MISRLALRTTAVALGLGLLVAACGDDTGTLPPNQNSTRMYNQVQRLGNPLVSEVFLAKRSHATHGATGPAQDVGLIRAELVSFVANVAGRNTTVQNTLASVLLPDMLIVQTDRDPGTSGWLGWALADGWGGRNLADDVVDAGLAATFGSLLDPSNVSPGLASDNVPSDSDFRTTFPYLAPANR
ncbi:MAG TPA: DUF4331 family protein [Gemmatimonadales bacterium]|nr:DUF4331 family protein [Gemmatimonadales bacterium]